MTIRIPLIFPPPAGCGLRSRNEVELPLLSASCDGKQIFLRTKGRSPGWCYIQDAVRMKLIVSDNSSACRVAVSAAGYWGVSPQVRFPTPGRTQLPQAPRRCDNRHAGRLTPHPLPHPIKIILRHCLPLSSVTSMGPAREPMIIR